jgi:hypothetical protein
MRNVFLAAALCIASAALAQNGPTSYSNNNPNACGEETGTFEEIFSSISSTGSQDYGCVIFFGYPSLSGQLKLIVSGTISTDEDAGVAILNYSTNGGSTWTYLVAYNGGSHSGPWTAELPSGTNSSEVEFRVTLLNLSTERGVTTATTSLSSSLTN